MSGVALLIAFVIAIVIMIVMISKYKVHPFLAIMFVSLLLAIVSKIELAKIPSIIGSGFSGIFTSIGIVIIFGALIGTILEKTGAALKLADIVVKIVGKKNPELAMLIMGWIVGIPVFCDSGFVVLSPIKNALEHKVGASKATMSCALSGGLYSSHVFVPPTPGPIAAAGALGVGASLFFVIIMGVVVSIPVLIAVYIYAKFIGKKIFIQDDETKDEISRKYDELILNDTKLPGALSVLAPIFVPIILMALGSVVSILELSGGFYTVLAFLGSPIIALGVGLLCGIYLLYITNKTSQFREMTEETLKLVGPILFITAAGGVLGKVIIEAGMVDFIETNATSIAAAGIFFPFFISAILKTAQGSSTVAIVTTASIMGVFSDPSSMMSALGLGNEISAVLTVMAIGAGAMTVSHANDSYFWVVTNFSKMTPEQGYKTQSVMTFIMGVVGIIWVYIISLVI